MSIILRITEYRVYANVLMFLSKVNHSCVDCNGQQAFFDDYNFKNDNENG